MHFFIKKPQVIQDEIQTVNNIILFASWWKKKKKSDSIIVKYRPSKTKKKKRSYGMLSSAVFPLEEFNSQKDVLLKDFNNTKKCLIELNLNGI